MSSKRKATAAEKRFLEMVAEERCIFAGRYGEACDGDIEVHHHGRKGLSQRVSHYRSVPLCEKHHRAEWHDSGTVGGFSRNDADLVITRESVRLLVQWAERCEADGL